MSHVHSSQQHEHVNYSGMGEVSKAMHSGGGGIGKEQASAAQMRFKIVSSLDDNDVKW